MESYSLDVESNFLGGYFSFEQIDLLSIIQCNDIEEIITFILNCDQLLHYHSQIDNIRKLSLEEAKKTVFKYYQDTMVFHNSDNIEKIRNRLFNVDITQEDIDIIERELLKRSPEIEDWLKEFIKNKYPKEYDKIFSYNHHFVSEERNQMKSDNLYEEMLLLNSKLSNFDNMLVDSGRIYFIVNKMYDSNEPTKRFDFYHLKRDLDFAYKNGKQVRIHSLLVKEDSNKLFVGKNKEEILQIIKEYVKAVIDFVIEYNRTHQIEINGEKKPVINAIDLFNEIISLFKNGKGEYYNIWEERYGISIEDLVSTFQYAKDNKPEGVKYLYNEPHLEDKDKRKKVFDVLDKIDSIAPGLIDTLGTQMHIGFDTPDEEIIDCFKDLKKLQEEKKKNIQITEFDLSLEEKYIAEIFGENPNISLQQLYDYKAKKIKKISDIINKSLIKLDGITYWSLTDVIDWNIERLRDNGLYNKKIGSIFQIPTACGGLYPTDMKLILKQNNEEINIEEKHIK